jgi:hypothetical protein
MGPEVKVLGRMRTRGVGFVLRKQTEEVAVRGFLDGLVRGTETVMTKVELAGVLYLVAVIGVLITSREEGEG